MVLRTRNTALLAKIETTESSWNAPDPTTDAILVEVTGSPVAFNPQIAETNEVSGSLDGSPPIVGGMQVTVSCTALLRGSGTPGLPPDYGVLLKACSFSENAIETAITSTAVAGTATTLTADTDFAATAKLYSGAPLLVGSGLSAYTFISHYTAGRVATVTDTATDAIGLSDYNGADIEIPECVYYQPHSSTTVPSLSLAVYIDGVLYRLVGCRGTATISAPTAQPARITFTMSGTVYQKVDAAVPATITYLSEAIPPVFRDGRMLINRAEAKTQEFSIDFGNQVIFPGNPNALEGFDAAIIVSRNVSGSVNPLETLVAERDIFTDFRSGTRAQIHGRAFREVGNAWGMTVHEAQYSGGGPVDRDGLSAFDSPFVAVGRDSSFYLALY